MSPKHTTYLRLGPVILFILFLWLALPLMSQPQQPEKKPKTQPRQQNIEQKKDVAPAADQATQKKPALQTAKEAPKSDSKRLQMTVDKVIHRIIHENFDLRNARYDIIKTDSDYLKFQKKFGYNLNGEASSTYLRMSENGNTSPFIIGTKQDLYSLSGGLSKYFSSGTSVSIALDHDYSKSNMKAPLFGVSESYSKLYKNTLSVSLQQSLMKNAFGYSDRLTAQNLRILGKVERAALINSLSGLIVSGLVDYWNLIVAEQNLATSKVELKNMEDLFAVVTRKNYIGLAQNFEVNQYRSLLYQSRNKVKLAEQSLFEARIKLLKNLNLDNDIQLESITQLFDQGPDLLVVNAYETAIKNRVDYRNALQLITIARNSLAIAENQGLPDVNLFASVGAGSQDTSMGTSFKELPTLDNPQLTVGVKATYTLDNQEAKTMIRDSRFQLRQARLKAMQIEKDIKDEVASLTEKVKILFDIYKNTKEAERQAMLYYYSVRQEIRRGRFSALVSKEALDNYIRSRYNTTQSLISYNITLLQLELAQNKIFDRFGLDIEKILQDPQWKQEDKNLSQQIRAEKK